VTALVLRLAVARALSSEAVWDGHYYDFGARRIAAGLGYSDDRLVGGHLVWHPWCHYPVGYSAFLALFYRLFGSGPLVVASANSLVGAALAPITWALARHAMSSARARAAGLIVAFHPGLVLYAALVMSEPLAALLTLLSFWLVVHFASRPGFVAGAAVLGVATLVRPQALLCAPFLAFGFRAARTRVVAGLSACAVALAVVMPWTARNCRVMDGCALVSTNAGWNLAIGAFPRATGRFETLRSSDGCRDVTGQVEQDRCWMKYGVAQIREHPWRWLSLVPAKLGYTFDQESFAVEYLHEARPDAWAEPWRSRARGVTTLVHRLLLAAAALGGVAFPLLHFDRASVKRGTFRHTPRAAIAAIAQGAMLVLAACLGALAFIGDSASFWPIAVFAAVAVWLRVPGSPRAEPVLLMAASLLATTIVTHAVFFGEDRYHVVVTPVLALLASAALRPAEA
jgi:4-amino-4-deoxy-L-arabinose transferase-like glycosyltransferase